MRNILVPQVGQTPLVAGFLFFQEAASPALVLGVLLTVAGMVMADRPG